MVSSAEKLTGVLQSTPWRAVSSPDFQPDNDWKLFQAVRIAWLSQSSHGNGP